MDYSRILVTGGSGFIGTNLIEYLLNQGYKVLNLDILKPKIQNHNFFFSMVDLLDYYNFEKSVLSFNPDIVIHLGARTDLRGKEMNDYAVNVRGVENLLNILDMLPKLKRVLFASSMYVCQPGYIPENYDDYKPHTIYGESKVLTEKIIKDRDPSYVWAIIRPTSIWGPFFGEPYNLFFKIVLSGKYFHMGSKACKKTYGYIGNFIYQLECILNVDSIQINKKVFYLGDYDPYDITIWANEIAFEKRIRIPNLPYPLFKLLGYVGDVFKAIGVNFPMTSFRLRNMTTDNVYNLDEIKKIAPDLPYSRIYGTRKTISWLEEGC